MGGGCFRASRTAIFPAILAVRAPIFALLTVDLQGMLFMEDDIERADNARKGSPFLNTPQAAHYIGLSRRTLEKMRTQGSGPRFRKHGRYVRYHIADLDDWSQAEGRNSTSDTMRKDQRI